MKLPSRSSRKRGAIASLGLVAIVPLLGAIGAISVDLMHNNDAIGALQRATDAAALAGAQDLASYKGPPLLATATTTSASANEDAVNAALNVSSFNIADGHSVHTGVVSGATVTATLSPTPKPTQCTVDATLPIHSIMAMIFGNFGQTINTHSVAGAGQVADTMGLYMPVLLSSTDADPFGRKLANATMGSTMTVAIKTNAVWIYNPDPVDANAIAAIAKPSANPPANLTPLTIGDTVRSDNGVKSAGSNFSLVDGMTVCFPVTSDSVGTSTPSHVIIGWVAMTITSVNPKNPNPSLTGTITPIVGPGFYTGKGQSPIFSSYTFFQQGATVKTAHLIQ